jgi:hypothetical protein
LHAPANRIRCLTPTITPIRTNTHTHYRKQQEHPHNYFHDFLHLKVKPFAINHRSILLEICPDFNRWTRNNGIGKNCFSERAKKTEEYGAGPLIFDILATFLPHPLPGGFIFFAGTFFDYLSCHGQTRTDTDDK